MKLIGGQAYASDRGRELDPGNLKGAKLGSPSRESGPESGPNGELRVEFSRCSGMLRAAQAWNSLAQPQLRIAYSSLRLQSLVLRSQSGNGIWRGQDSGGGPLFFLYTFPNLPTIGRLHPILPTSQLENKSIG
jgi:hypothetical protein